MGSRFIILALIFSSSLRATVPTAWAQINHVVVVVLENTKATDAMRQPFQQELMRRGAYLSNYFAITHPSQPNYIAMIAGDTLGVDNDSRVNLRGQMLGDLLELAGKTWRVYAEDYPGNCFLGRSQGLYVRKHVPFLSFTSVQQSSDKCANIVSATQFENDIAHSRLPSFSFYIPNLNNDGHDTNPGFADQALRTTFSSLLGDKAFTKDTLLVVTYDEDDGSSTNQVYTVLVGDSVAPGSRSTVRYDHYSLLRTVEDIFKLGTLHQNDQTATPILDVWKSQ